MPVSQWPRIRADVGLICTSSKRAVLLAVAVIGECLKIARNEPSDIILYETVWCLMKLRFLWSRNEMSNLCNARFHSMHPWSASSRKQKNSFFILCLYWEILFPTSVLCKLVKMYNNNNTVPCVFFDASIIKASNLDRAVGLHCKLFKLLKEKGMPSHIIWVLLNLYMGLQVRYL
jgi:hypothetical protein